MDAGEWEVDFTEARQRLLESSDFQMLVGRGHDLRNGVVLTSVSDVPFEVSLKCIYCGVAFWFENAAWATGGEAEWRLSSSSMRQSDSVCFGSSISKLI
jgi:hypothetical protein